MPRYAVGIDLGTTNCALAAIDLQSGRSARAESFPVPQIIDVGDIGPRRLLPSFLYLAAEGEFPPDSFCLPWNPSPTRLVGEGARKLGSRIPSRLVSSAKSWLCHAGVDRRAKILPWQSDWEGDRLSPVEASAAYLSHLKEAWNAAHPDASLADQVVVLTIPASFDEVARELTVQAAHDAGLPKITLLEEPQAAFYQWLEEEADEPLAVGTSALVIDCGGGTTDFSLLAVVEEQGRPAYRRVAVGDHLLLGGDNLDIALARHVEDQLAGKIKPDLSQWWSLVLDARRLKETMLGEDPPEAMTITVLGRGGKLIGGSQRVEVDRATVLRIALDGFFPRVAADEFPTRAGRSGLQEFGLPYVSDPAITRHLAQFVSIHREGIAEISPTQDARPSAILFNGGLFHARQCRDRILEVMKSWYSDDWQPRVLYTSSLDLAVAEGAAHFAMRKSLGQDRIKSGAARSYYIGLAGAENDGKALCIVPQGLAEGDSLTLDEPMLELKIGEPVAFPLFSSTVRPKDVGGTMVTARAGQLAELPSLTTILRGGKRAGRTKMSVRLESKLTEIGTLELYCVSRDGNNRWKLPFQTRSSPRLASEEPTEREEGLLTETWSEEQLSGARTAIETTFGSRSVNPATLPKQLEAALQLRREDWPSGVLRALWETFLAVAPKRSLSPEHEARWYNLVGFALRPGWGDPLDPFRVELLWKVVHAGVVNSKSDAAWTEYWTMCRRVAGGLDPSRQMELGHRLLAYLPISSSRKAPRKVGSHELAEIWRAAASLEHLALPAKVELGRHLVEEASAGRLPIYLFWSLARVGGRVPLYGPANMVVPAVEVERWISPLLGLEIQERSQRIERAFALVQLARKTGDRGRDVDASLVDRILSLLSADDVSDSLLRPLREVVESDRAEQTRLLGDKLPRGLAVVTG